MPKQFFLKSLVNNRIHDKHARVIKFEPISDGRGIVELDDTNEEHKSIIEALNAYIAKKLGGVTAIDSAKFEDLKKNHPAPDPSVKAKKNAPKLFEASRDPFKSRQASAQPATAPASVSPAVAASNVVAVAGVADSAGKPIPSPISKGRPAIQTNKTKAAAAAPTPAPTPAPVPTAEPAAATPTPSAGSAPVTTATPEK